MRKFIIACAIAVSAAGFAASAQADSFLVGLLQGVNWQVPKCSNPEVLTQVKDRAGHIHFRCMKPASR